MNYRPDIDGLRALAVIPVVLFHAGVPGFTGGYVGVDVFFVISGYLITSLILAQQYQGQFTLLWFYERRIRRILPALFVVMIACAIIGWLVMAPNDYKSLGGSIFATSIFLSNVLFWYRSGYFEPVAEEQPLLHTWSLAVEEQYYLVFPLLMMLMTRVGKRRLVHIIIVLAVASFVSCSVLVFYDPTSAFYLSPFRVWELFLGSLLATKTFPSLRRRNIQNFCSALGVGFIFVAILFYSKETVFPGISALLPACGTALFIWAGAGTLPATNRFIASKPLVFIGKISYSLYLWHFILLKFGSYMSIGKITPIQVSILLALSLVLAFLSWLLIEQPVRRATFSLFKGYALLGITGLAITGTALVGGTIHATNGFETRLSPVQLGLLAASSEMNADRSNCVPVTLLRAKSHQFCKLGNVNLNAPSFFVWGDSHALPLRLVLNSIAKKRGATGLLAASAGCLPLIDIARKEPTFADCAETSQHIFEFIVAERSIENVILIARWGYFAEGTSYKDEPTDRFRIKHALLENISTPESKPTHEVLAIAFDRTISALLAAGKRIWIVGPIPEVGINVPKSLYLKSLGIGRSYKIEPTRLEFNLRQVHVFQILETVAQRYPVRIVWPHTVLCDKNTCMVEALGKSLYQDENHLSFFGAKSIEGIFESVQF